MGLGGEIESLGAEGGGAGERRVVYCLIPRELAPKLHELLRGHFADDPDVEVLVERREGERRRGEDRRAGSGEAPGRERRVVRSRTGRRFGERRAAIAEVEPLPVPRRARRYADQLRFAERLEPSTQELEDRDTARLVTRFQAGDQEAFSALYVRYYDRAYSYLRVLLRDTHDAEDATQQVFVKLFEALPRYERRSQPFRAWLLTVVRNVAFDELRQRGRLELEENQVLERRREAAGTEEPQEIDILGWIADRDLLVLFERLALPQRQVLLLRFMLDLTGAEIAQVLDRSPEDVRVLQHRALRFLEERLTALGRGPREHRRAKMRTAKRHAPVLRTRRFALM